MERDILQFIIERHFLQRENVNFVWQSTIVLLQRNIFRSLQNPFKVVLSIIANQRNGHEASIQTSYLGMELWPWPIFNFEHR